MVRLFILLLLCSIGVSAQTIKKAVTLPSGLYEVVPESDYGFRDGRTKALVYIKNTNGFTVVPWVKNVRVKVEASQAQLVIETVDAGRAVLKTFTTRLTGKKTALIIGNRLILVAPVVAAIPDGKMAWMGGRANSMQEFMAYKVMLDNEMKAARK